MFEKEHTVPPTGRALSLTGLENMTNEEKFTRITAVANDMAASIVYIAKQAESGNLTTQHTTPIYNLIENMLGAERSQKRSLIRELEKQDARISSMERQHRRDIQELMACANSALAQLKARADQLEVELKVQRGCNTVDNKDTDIGREKE